MKNNFYYWFPVIPFLSYWTFSYLAFHFGPFVTPEVNFDTHLYFVFSLVLFIITYKLGLGSRLKNINYQYSNDNVVALKVLNITIWLTFIGTLLFLVDRINSGAGSFELVRNNMDDIRQYYAGNTTFLTTIGALPQSFFLITLSTYFYCGMHRLPICRYVHILIFLTFVCQILNMILSANRGVLFWIATYAIFYIFFCARKNLLKVIFSRKYFFVTIIAFTFCIVSLQYFLFVAQNRVGHSTAIYLGQNASYLLKNQRDISGDNYATIGAKYQIFEYVTHGFVYIDAILQNAPVINFDFLSPLGVRIESQIARFSPGYVFPAKENIITWVESAGLSRFGWPTIFGATLAYFGVIGSLIFFNTIGFIAGYSTRRFVQSNKLGWLVIVFTIYSSLNLSFDWILRNFDQYMALFVGIYLVYFKSININNFNHIQNE